MKEKIMDGIQKGREKILGRLNIFRILLSNLLTGTTKKIKPR